MTVLLRGFNIDFLTVKSKDFFSNRKFLWLGAIGLLLAVFLILIFVLLSNKTGSKSKTRSQHQPSTDLSDSNEQDSMLKQMNFKEKYDRYQAEYLKMVRRINERDQKLLTASEAADITSALQAAKAEYEDVLRKYEKDEMNARLKCFSEMKDMIRAVLYYDKKTGAKMTRLNLRKLKAAGAIVKTPTCPKDGRYSIIYKDGSRIFNCSVHGVLRH